ncbi:hypothetical protein M422DRAFT_24061, partial [Sphaerobolus stellatus SS14]
MRPSIVCRVSQAVTTLIKQPPNLQLLQDDFQALTLSRRLFAYRQDKIRFLQGSPTIDDIPAFGGAPEIIFTGRANVGKSTLINKICGRELAVTSKTAGRTQALNFFGVRDEVPPLHIVLVDAPGYGSRGRAEWGQLFDHYIQNRKELRCVYILINAQDGVVNDDKLMLSFLEESASERPFHIQPVLTKLDKLQYPAQVIVARESQAVLSQIAPTCLPIIYTGFGKGAKRFGLDVLRISLWYETRNMPPKLSIPLGAV